MGFKILTWNISYGYGIGSEGDDRYFPKSQAHFETSLNAMGETIKRIDPDVVLLQEVDFDSQRSCGISELDFLSRRSGLLHRRALTTWDRAYVPYPGLDPRRQFGRIRSGGGILSKTPIKVLQEDLLAKPRENSRIYNYFYLSRFLQMVEIRGLKICNLHLEAFSKDNRELHLVRLQDRLREYELDLVGGDFNGIPTLSQETLETWAVIAPPKNTFPSDVPLHALDHFVVRRGIMKNPMILMPDTGVLSDHLPVLLQFETADKA